MNKINICLLCKFDKEDYNCNCEYCQECCLNKHNDFDVSEYDRID